ncbi:MAG: MFS transporter [Thermovirgaceae bacterium]
MWILAVAVGVAHSGVQTISRSTFGLMIPQGGKQSGHRKRPCRSQK